LSFISVNHIGMLSKLTRSESDLCKLLRVTHC
jgi:hypothetical protein